MARGDSDKTLPMDSICGSVARVFRGVAGVQQPDGTDPLASSFEAACKIAERTFAAAGDNGDVAVSVDELAARMSRQFCIDYGADPLPVSQMPHRVALAWRTAARHVANLLLAEDSSDIADCERKIFEWAAARL